MTRGNKLRAGQDHPRRCGENRKRTVLYVIDTGSPPQVRGKRAIIAQCVLYSGITPAGAGKTETGVIRLKRAKDHPRRCGENVITCISGAGISGSPPQVRGKHAQEAWENARKRITPAGAGKTETVKGIPAAEEDHPRRCGENKSAVKCAQNRTGSPPQVRGKLYTQL